MPEKDRVWKKEDVEWEEKSGDIVEERRQAELRNSKWKEAVQETCPRV